MLEFYIKPCTSIPAILDDLGAVYAGWSSVGLVEVASNMVPYIERKGMIIVANTSTQPIAITEKRHCKITVVSWEFGRLFNHYSLIITLCLHLIIVLTTHLSSAAAVTVSCKQTMFFSAAHGRRTWAISLTVEYIRIEADSLDSPAKGLTPETGVI